MAFINNSQVKAFPVALSVAGSKFTSEDNITGIIRAVVDRENYIISGANNEYEFVLHGYYFKIIYSAGSSDMWVGIYTDNSNRLIGFTDRGAPTTEIDSGDYFRGLIIGTTQRAVTRSVSSSYSHYYLQILDDGQLVEANMSKFNSTALDGSPNYDPDSDKVISGKGVKAALDTLDVAKVGQTGYFISEISETDGKISATASQFSVSNTLTSGTSSAGPKISTSVNSITGSTVELNKATTSAYGVTKLATSISTDTTTAATPNLVNSVNSRLGTRISALETRVDVPASNNTLGGIKLGYTQSGKNYPVVLDSNNRAYVNVPWSAGESYSLPVASNSTRGGIKIGYTQSGKNYPVQLSSEKAYVNVPWSDTTYSGTDPISISNNNEITLGTVPVGKGGTGRTTVSGAKTNLGIPTVTSGTSLPSSGAEGDIFILY